MNSSRLIMREWHPSCPDEVKSLCEIMCEAASAEPEDGFDQAYAIPIVDDTVLWEPEKNTDFVISTECGTEFLTKVTDP